MSYPLSFHCLLWASGAHKKAILYQSRSKWWRDAILSFFQGSLSFPADSFRFICPNISGKRYLCTYNAELYMIIEDRDNVKRLIAEKEGGQVE
ncbi:MAG TPA: hypothetical protein K8U81_09040, partial [Phocaeicola coprocola]|nr:hypothetical protein [Phocaeicola coprocola]